MIIKKIIVDNIRSFEHEEIEFKDGSTLLAGDIGSGKTSILLAIEFGLFGLQPGQRGSSILRNDKDWGGVKLFFEIKEKNIILERSLKRTKTVSQEIAAITIDGIREEMSVTELKSRVLDLLNYPSEFSKKQNLLYKYTVYTPQEEMKQIILEDTEARLNTLRHVFGVDKYRRIMENVSTIKLKIREERRVFEGVTSNLENDKKLLETKELSLRENERNIFTFKEDLRLKKEKRKNKEQEKEAVAKYLEDKSNLRAKLGQTQGMLHSKNEIFKNNEKEIEILKEEIQKFRHLNFNLLEMQDIEDEILKKKKQKEKLSQLNLEINSKISSIKSKIEEYQTLEKKMQSLEICPTCLQKVDAVYRANVLNKNYNELSKAKNEIETLEIEKNTILEKIKEIDISLDLSERRLTDLKILKMKLEGIEEKELKSNQLKKENTFYSSDIKLLEKQIESIKGDLLVISKYDVLIEEKTKELELAFKEEKESEIKLAEHNKVIEMQRRSIEELKERIGKIESIKEKLEYLLELESWLNMKFIPLISFVEKNVMVNLKYEFSRLFSDWFSTLVPEGLSARVSDDFTPIIEQKDYEIDYAYLSGGERTAIALAYRLALTQVINSLMSKIKTKDLVILDEPTDGFSSQQLDKMREVLIQLNVKQLIIVSHEQKIESFVQNVIRFKKEYGVSKQY